MQISKEARTTKLKRLFEAESQLPLATNEDSWSEAAFARPGLPRPWSRLQHQSSSSRQQSVGTDEGDDEVFEDVSKCCQGYAGPPLEGAGDFVDHVQGAYRQGRLPSACSGRSSPESYGDAGTERSYGISWVADDVDTVHTLSDHQQPTYEYTDTGMVDAATCLDVLCYLWGAVGYLWDVISDLWLAYKYYNLGHTTWFALTLVFVAAPAICMSVFSLVLYIRDHRVVGVKVSAPSWIPRVVFLLLQLAPLWRCVYTQSDNT